MKKLFFIFSCCCTTVCFAQIGVQNNKPVKKRVRTYRQTSYTPQIGEFDSARYYYLRAWDAYKIQDFGAARYYWERGANCKTITPARYSSAFRLGLMHQNGEGIGVNYEIAFYYYNLAYAKGQKIGNNEATKVIAAYYENGLGTMPNYYKALEWYQKAKNQGNQYCDEDIVRVKTKIKEYERD